MKFIAREKEIKQIEHAFNSDHYELILIYGRRHVGKTELIRKCCQNFSGKSFYYMCRQVKEPLLINGFTEIINSNIQLDGLYFRTFEDCLRYLFKLGQKETIVAVLDEYPNARNSIDGLDSMIQALSDEYKSSSKLKLILSGSYINIMKELKGEKEPLFGRITLNIDLKPMNYYDSSLFYPAFSNEEKVQLYSTFGGIPLYNSLIDENKSVKENIIDLIASENARLADEVNLFLKAELSKLENAFSVFSALAEGNKNYKEIQKASGIESPGVLNDVLNKLINMEVVRKEFPINKENDRTKSRYTISDNLFFFHFKYIARYASQIRIMEPDIFYDRFIHNDFFEHYVPFSFENICREFLMRRNKKGLVDPPIERIGKFHYDSPSEHKNGEFDIVTEDAKGYIFYEAKYKSQPVTLGMIEKEIQQVRQTNLQSYMFGFFSKSGYSSTIKRSDLILYTLDDLYKSL